MGDDTPSRRPRLLSVGTHSVASPFGDNEQLAQIYTAVAGHCERVDLVVGCLGSEGYEHRADNLHVHAIPHAGGLLGRLGYLRRAARAIRDLDRSAAPDVYWCSDPFDSGLLAWSGARRRCRPLVVQLQGDMYRFTPARFGLLKRAAISWLTTALSRRATRVRVLTEDLAGQLRKRGVRPERIVIIPTRTDFDLFSPERWAEEGARLRTEWGWDDKLVVLYAGALNPTKGPDLLLRGVAKVAEELPDLRVAFAGDGPQLSELAVLVDNLDIQDRVRFEGWVPYTRLPALYAAADANCVPSRDEGMGRGAIQGAAMEQPAILTAVGGNHEVLQHGCAGWLVPPTAEGLADGLRQLAALSPEERRVIGQAARQASEPVFGFQGNIARMAEEMAIKLLDAW